MAYISCKLDAAAAGAATPAALLVRAPERDHVHRRGVLYIPLSVPPPIPRRHIRRDLASSSIRRLGEAEPLGSNFSARGASLSRPRYRPKAGEEPSRPGPHAKITRFMPDHRRLGPHVLSHPPPVRARRSAARGQCGRAELALRHRCLRCRPGGAAARAEVLSWPQIG